MRMKFLLVAVGLAAATLLAPTAAATTAPADTVERMSASVEPLSGPTFDAYSGASNKRGLWLKFPTDPGAEVCTSRDIYLAAGEYDWYHSHDGNIPDGWATWASRNIDLAAGWYVWKDCLFAPSHGTTYYHDTYLRQKSTGGYAHLDRVKLWTSSRGTFWAEFGSSLTQR